MGAWIEIWIFTVKCRAKKVAPLVGAWIEILDIARLTVLFAVAPLVGAWIEIEKYTNADT